MDLKSTQLFFYMRNQRRDLSRGRRRELKGAEGHGKDDADLKTEQEQTA